MVYNWNTEIFPENPKIGMTFIDNNNIIYEYKLDNNEIKCWNINTNAIISENKSFKFNLYGCLINDSESFNKRFNNKKFNNYEYDVYYKYSYIKIEEIDALGDLSNIFYIKFIDTYDLCDWCSNHIQNESGAFISNLIVTYYDLIDKSLNINTITGSNSFYGGLRGSKSYTEKKNRITPSGDGILYDISTEFTKKYPIYLDLGKTLINHFFGLDTSLNLNSILWFSLNKRSLYNQPKLSSIVSKKSHYTYNLLTDTIDYIGADPIEFLVGEPKLLKFNMDTIEILECDEYNKFYKMHSEPPCVLIYPLIHDNFRSFLIKPLSINRLTFEQFNEYTKYDLFSITYYNSEKLPKIKNLYYSKIDQSHRRRIDISSAIKIASSSSEYNLLSPNETYFFFMNNLTKIRGENSKTYVQLIRGLNNVSSRFKIDKKI